MCVGNMVWVMILVKFTKTKIVLCDMNVSTKYFGNKLSRCFACHLTIIYILVAFRVFLNNDNQKYIFASLKNILHCTSSLLPIEY